MPAYGSSVPPLLDLFGKVNPVLNPVTLNPATVVTLILLELSRIYGIYVDYPFEFFLVIVISNLLFWVPMARYVMIPLLNRVFYPKRKDGRWTRP